MAMLLLWLLWKESLRCLPTCRAKINLKPAVLADEVSSDVTSPAFHERFLCHQFHAYDAVKWIVIV